MLICHDQFRDPLDRTGALFQIVHQLLGRSDFFPDITFCIFRRKGIIQHFQVAGDQPQTGRGIPDRNRLKLAVFILLHQDLRLHIDHAAGRDAGGRVGRQFFQFCYQLLQPVHGQIHGFGDLGQTVLCQVVQIFFDQFRKARIMFARVPGDLQQQTFLQITGTDPRRIKCLDQRQRLFCRLNAALHGLGDFGGGRLKIAVVPDVPDDLLRHRTQARRGVGKVQLFQQLLLKRFFGGERIKNTSGLFFAAEKIGPVFQITIQRFTEIIPVLVQILRFVRRILRTAGRGEEQIVFCFFLFCIRTFRYFQNGIRLQFRRDLFFQFHPVGGKNIKTLQLMRRNGMLLRHINFL